MKKFYNLKIAEKIFIYESLKSIKENLKKELLNFYDLKDVKRALSLYSLDIKTAFWGSFERQDFESMYFESVKNINISIKTKPLNQG